MTLEPEIIETENLPAPSVGTSPEFFGLVVESVNLRKKGMETLKALKAANTAKRTDNTPFFEAVDMLDGVKATLTGFERLRTTAKAPFLAMCRAIDNVFKGRGGRMAEPETLRDFLNALELALIEYRTREMPDDKTVRTPNGVSATFRVTKNIRVKDEKAFIKACISTAKGNTAYTSDFLKIDMAALKKAFDANPDAFKKLVEYEYKTGVV